ncbi:hypothetical protein M3685_25795 [Heyndrickxia oleronia]|uniref:hypothetical protein n=1 Tax=Heyndrickxia oleronia TaxID=38875 RepID=UPI001C0EEB24|nr:hypothetical protein [Heyndrickxia oleronia]MBU5214931.1 hypothetical protein [Heyndrickxia oleronia]MCM3457293.1 hypothetical protein [Heyndrickxia oleronia]
MTSKKVFGQLFPLLQVLCCLFHSYSIADDPTNPTSYEKIIIKIFFFSFIFSMVASMYSGILGLKRMKKGY